MVRHLIEASTTSAKNAFEQTVLTHLDGTNQFSITLPLLQTIRIIPPSLVVVAWAALGTAKMAREFLGDGLGGIQSISPGLPVAVVGGENDGKVRVTARCYLQMAWG